MHRFLLLFAVGVLVGCTTPPESEEPVVDVDASMEYLKPGLRPEVLLFPEYLLMDECELHQHGRIPETALVGGGMKTPLSLSVVRRRYTDALATQDWVMNKMEIGRQSFRLIALHGDEWLEIRAVQGGGPTQIFVLYEPVPETPGL